MRTRLLQVSLWWAVLGLSLWIGGTVFNMLTIVPLWATSPPESVWAFFGGTDFKATVTRFFGPPWMAFRVIPIIVALGLAWNRPGHRRLLLVTTATMLFGIALTLVYIYPINDVLFGQAGRSGGAVETADLVNRWIIADRLRFVVVLVGYVALLRAFQLPIDASS